MDDNEITNEITPLYRRFNDILIGLTEDYPEEADDGLVVMVDLDKKQIIGHQVSYQRIIKHGYWDWIEVNQRQQVLKQVYESFGAMRVNEIIDLLLNPPMKSIQSLLWKPDRLRGEATNDFEKR
jgi:hypothetical protein